MTKYHYMNDYFTGYWLPREILYPIYLSVWDRSTHFREQVGFIEGEVDILIKEVAKQNPEVQRLVAEASIKGDKLVLSVDPLPFLRELCEETIDRDTDLEGVLQTILELEERRLELESDLNCLGNQVEYWRNMYEESQ